MPLEPDILTTITEEFAGEVDGERPSQAIPSDEELRRMSIEDLRTLDKRISATVREQGLVHLNPILRKKLSGIAQGPTELPGKSCHPPVGGNPCHIPR